MARGSGKRRPRQGSTRHYPRTARLNALLHEIVADYFELTEDEKLGFFTITGVEVDSDLNVAQVYVSVFDDQPSPEGDAIFLGALAAHRVSLQRAIASQAKLRKTPEVAFAFDPGVRTGSRVEEILRDLDPLPAAAIDGPAGDAGNDDPGNVPAAGGDG